MSVSKRALPLLLIALSWTAPAAFALIERTVERRFNPGTHAGVKVDVHQGAIAVSAAEDGEIHVVVKQSMDVSSDRDADRLLEALDLTLVQRDRQVIVRARDRKVVRWSWEQSPPVGLSYTIKVPPWCRLDLVTNDGPITITNLQGDLRIRTGKGAIFAGEIDGSVDAASLQGDVAVTACTKSLTLETGSGNILVGRSLGKARLKGAGGTLEIQSARATVQADADGADVKIAFAHPITEPSTLSATGGDVVISVDARSRCILDAQASRFGTVKTRELDLKIAEGEVGASKLVGHLNEGGPRITLRAGGGNIRINGVPSLP